MADLVSPLYNYLYGQTEPEKMKGVQPSYNKIEINEIQSPITVGKLIEKFKDIKIDTAARTDQIKKLYFKKKGTLHVFDKLCSTAPHAAPNIFGTVEDQPNHTYPQKRGRARKKLKIGDQLPSDLCLTEYI